ncbi:hypothetical protein MUP05_05550 [Candidatus Bathyarchaeota archaeon]|nr:hypothetical protein [Candidatus Bathyarchaeota archaeon]
MSEGSKLKVVIEWGSMKHVAEGDADTVLKEVTAFIAKVFPAFEPLSKILFTPDYMAMLTDLSSLVNIGPNGEIILVRSGLSADQAIGLTLLGSQIASKIGKKQSDDMSVEELASSIRKTSKTVRNTVVEMCKASLVERTGRGTYRITTIGMKELLDDMKAMLESEKNQQGGSY